MENRGPERLVNKQYFSLNDKKQAKGSKRFMPNMCTLSRRCLCMKRSLEKILAPYPRPNSYSLFL